VKVFSETRVHASIGHKKSATSNSSKSDVRHKQTSAP